MTLSVGPQGPSLPALLSGVGEVLIYHHSGWSGLAKEAGRKPSVVSGKRASSPPQTDSQLLPSAQSGSSQQDPPQG